MVDAIGLSNYTGQALNGFGIGTQGNVDELHKALQAGYQLSSQTGGSALRVESLEGSLKVVAHTAHHIRFWKKIPKSPAYSTVEEYNQLTAYGAADAGAFVGEGELPPTQDSSYIRKTSLVKYIGTTREVTHQMTVVHPSHGDVIALENMNGILWLLERVENSLFKGDSSLAFSGESEQWDGLDSQIDPTSFIDLEGNPLQEADVEEGSNQLVEQFAYPTDLWLGTRTASDLQKQFYPRERINLPAPQNGMVGLSINSVQTQAGVMELNPDVFIKKLPSPPAAATSANAPVAPASVAGVVNALATTGDFNKGAPAGTNRYYYRASIANRFGESATVLSAAVNITQAQKDAGNTIDVTITNAGALGAFLPEYIKLYRTSALAAAAAAPGLTGFSLIMQVPAASQAGAGTTLASDLNFILPFTSMAYMGEMTPSVLTFRQLLPMMRLDLAVLSPAYRWTILLYGTPVLFAPKKWLRFVNIGTLV